MCAPPTEDSLMHRWLHLRVVVCIGILIGWPTAALASFDCARPHLKVDYVICGSSSAQNANDELTDAWRRVNTLLDPEQRRELLADQRQWISMYGGLCNVPGNGRPTKGQIDRATKCVIEKKLETEYMSSIELPIRRMQRKASRNEQILTTYRRAIRRNNLVHQSLTISKTIVHHPSIILQYLFQRPHFFCGSGGRGNCIPNESQIAESPEVCWL